MPATDMVASTCSKQRMAPSNTRRQAAGRQRFAAAAATGAAVPRGASSAACDAWHL